MMKDRDRYITVQQTANRLDVGTQTVYNMLRDGRLGGRYSKGKNKKKGSWQVSVESIELFIKYTSITSIYQLKEK